MDILQYLKPSNVPPSVRQKGILAVQREIILQNVMNIFLQICNIGFLIYSLAFPQLFRSGHAGYYLIGLLIFDAIAIIRSINYWIRASVIVVALQALGVSALMSFGLSGTGLIFVFGSTVLASLLFNRWSTLFFFGGGLVEIVTVGYLMSTNPKLLPPVEVMANSGNLTQWVTAAVVLIFVQGIISRSNGLVIGGMSSTLESSDRLTKELEEERTSLENRVEERSADLRKRVEQFQIASEIAREISGETNLENLLNRAVNLVRDRFGFYHVGVFLNDEKNEYAVLRAATGEAGRSMLERNHRLKIGEIGIVGYAVSHGEARIAMDVESDVVHYKNPLLPETRSEMALPLMLGDRTIGALDVQSIIANGFLQEDVQILKIIGDQLAIAFEKTRLVENLQHTVDELESTTRAATQRAWRLHLKNSRQKLAYRYRENRLDTQVVETPHAQDALNKGQSILRIIPGKDIQGRPVTVLGVPIKMRNQVLGVVDIQFDSANISPDLISLIEGTVNRLAVSLENARLLEEIQFRAERERLVGDISSKVRAASDVDSVLRIAIEEIGRSLGVSEVMVQLRKES